MCYETCRLYSILHGNTKTVTIFRLFFCGLWAENERILALQSLLAEPQKHTPSSKFRATNFHKHKVSCPRSLVFNFSFFKSLVKNGRSCKLFMLYLYITNTFTLHHWCLNIFFLSHTLSLLHRDLLRFILQPRDTIVQKLSLLQKSKNIFKFLLSIQTGQKGLWLWVTQQHDSYSKASSWDTVYNQVGVWEKFFS